MAIAVSTDAKTGKTHPKPAVLRETPRMKDFVYVGKSGSEELKSSSLVTSVYSSLEDACYHEYSYNYYYYPPKDL